LQFNNVVNDENRDFNEVIRMIRKEDSRYQRGAYYFLRQALDFSLKQLQQEDKPRENQHLSGQQLLEGIRRFGIQQYGPMVLQVLNYWGIKECRDFGNVVFNLVECRVLGKTEQDRPEDFDGGYDFLEAFDQPFRPRKTLKMKRPVYR